MTVYVQRTGGVINGVYGNLQPGIAEEAVDDSDAGVVAFRAVADSIRTIEQTKYATLVTKATQAVTANTTYLSIPNPNAAQMQAQLTALTQQVNAILKRITQMD